MDGRTLLNLLHVAERLKDTTRHCDTSGGRRESVAEHSFRLALMAYWMKDEFPGVDIDKVIKMCLIHDLGEAFTGDVPVFLKTKEDSKREEELLQNWLDEIPEPFGGEMKDLYQEMELRETEEAKLYKALDGMEALIQHNEADIETWEENEYDLQMTYCDDRVTFSEYLTKFRQLVREDSIAKIEEKNNRT